MAVIQWSTSNNLAEVSAQNEVRVIWPLTYNANLNPEITGGFVNNIFEADSGSETGAPTQRQGDISANYRSRVAVDSLLFNENFNWTALNTRKFLNTATTFVTGVSGGFINLNNTNLTTANATNVITTRPTFPAYGTYPLQGECEIVYTTAWSAPVANNTTEIGFWLATGTTAPTDWSFFRYNSAGALQFVLNYNGSETAENYSGSNVPSVNARHHYAVVQGNDYVEFWIDNILYKNMAIPAAQGMATINQNMPFFVRSYNAAVVPSAYVNIKVSNISISQGDMNATVSIAEQMSAMQNMAIQGQTGSTMGSTANYVNSTVPATATLSNTAAGYATLGGQFVFAAVAGAETDYALFAYQVPVSTAANPSQKLVVTDVNIAVWSQVVAVATTPTVMHWSLGIGSTAVSLATADAATTKSRAVYPLWQTNLVIAEALGTGHQLNWDFTTPLTVNPWEYIHIILKIPTGTATATQTFRGTIGINGYNR